MLRPNGNRCSSRPAATFRRSGGFAVAAPGESGEKRLPGERLNVTDPSRVADEEEHLSNVHATRRTMSLLAIAAALALAMLLPAAAAGRQHGTRPGRAHGHQGKGHDHGHATGGSRGRRDDPQPLPRRRPRPGDRSDDAGRARRSRRRDPPRGRRQRLPDPGQGARERDPSDQARTWSGCRRSRSGRALRSRPTATPVNYDYLELLLNQLNKGPGTPYRVVVVQTGVRSRSPRRHERSPRRRASARIRKRRAPRPPDDAGRDPRPQRRRGPHLERAGRQLQHPDRTPDPGPAETDREGLDLNRRQGARQRPVPFRQHASGVVPSADPPGSGR